MDMMGCAAGSSGSSSAVPPPALRRPHQPIHSPPSLELSASHVMLSEVDRQCRSEVFRQFVASSPADPRQTIHEFMQFTNSLSVVSDGRAGWKVVMAAEQK